MNKRDAKDGEVGIIGYEVNFNRYFYNYVPPRALEVIDAELKLVEQEILDLLNEVDDMSNYFSPYSPPLKFSQTAERFLIDSYHEKPIIKGNNTLHASRQICAPWRVTCFWGLPYEIYQTCYNLRRPTQQAHHSWYADR